MNRLKAEGQIGKTDFSYHGDAATLEKILQAHPDVDVVQLQINYLDWDDPAMEAHKCYDVAARYGKEIVVMEPVKGGTLADLPKRAVQFLQQAAPNESIASWAIRFAQSLELVYQPRTAAFLFATHTPRASAKNAAQYETTNIIGQS